MTDQFNTPGTPGAPDASSAAPAGMPALQLVPRAGMSRAEAKVTARALMKGRMGPLVVGTLIVLALALTIAGLDQVVSDATGYGSTIDTNPGFLQSIVYFGFSLLTMVFSVLLQFGYRAFGEEFTYGRPISATRVFSAFERFGKAWRVALAYLWLTIAWTIPGVILAVIVVTAGTAGLYYNGVINLDPVISVFSTPGANFTGSDAEMFAFMGVILVIVAASIICILPFALYANYRYFQAPYIMAHNPELSGSEVMRRSSRMMRGHKWELFVYDLSFFWWSMLMMVTFGLAYFYVAPYMNVTYGIYHRNLMESYVDSDATLASVAPVEVAVDVAPVEAPAEEPAVPPAQDGKE